MGRKLRKAEREMIERLKGREPERLAALDDQVIEGIDEVDGDWAIKIEGETMRDEDVIANAEAEVEHAIRNADSAVDLKRKQLWDQYVCAAMTTLAPWISKELLHYNSPQDMAKLVKYAAELADALMVERDKR